MSVKVWLVDYGEYSDYGIPGIFSTKEKAQHFVDVRRTCEDGRTNDPREFELDNVEMPVPTDYWVAKIEMDSGDVFKQEKRTFAPQVNPHKGEQGAYLELVWYPLPHGNIHMVQGVSPKSAEHAMKLAVECRQAILREKVEP